MLFTISKARISFLALLSLVFFSSFFPLFSQNLYEDDEFDYDDFLFMEQEGSLTIVGTHETSQHKASISKDEIEQRNAPDMATLLQEALGLNITRYGAYGNMTLLNLRGLDSKRLAFLIDGVPVNSSMDSGFDIEQIDLNSVERIEVIYGGSDTKYNVSGAMGGVINIITVKKRKPGLRLGASISNTSAMPGEYRDRNGETKGPHWEDLLDTQNLTVSAGYGGNGFSLSANAFANRVENHFLFKDSYNYTRRKDNNEVWDTGAGTSAVWELPDLTKFIASANFYYGDKNIPSSGFSSVFGKQQDLSARGNAMVDMPRAWHDDLAMEASLGWNFFRKDYTSPVGELSCHDQNNITAVNRWNWYPGELLVLKSGLDYHFAFLDSTEVGNRNRHSGGVYMTAEYKPWKPFLIIPSIKIALSSGAQGGVTPVPKLGFLWNVNDSLSIKNNYFRSFKYPDFQDLYWVDGNAAGAGTAGNPELRPEDGWGADLGLAWRFNNQFTLDSTFFTNWLKDSIHWYPDSGGIWRPENVGEAVFFGMENKLNFDIPVSLGSIKKITASVSYQYLLSYLLSFGYDFASDKRIPYNPMHTIGISFDIPWANGSLLISGQYESLRYQDRPNFVELKPHFLLNATINQKIGQKIGKSFTLFGVVRNALNTSYQSFYDYPMPGITLTLGVRMQYETNQEAK